MKQFIAPFVMAIALSGCMTMDNWSEAPGQGVYVDERGAPVDWWGNDVASSDVFYDPLSPYGRWDSYSGYGRVFWPSNTGPGWQPYSHGRWVNDSRWGRRWVSSEPFGWATYHYGRWGRDPSRGWFWVPGRQYAGSWVDWRHDGGRQYWAPRAPGGWEGRHGKRDRDWWVDRDDAKPRPNRIPPNSHPRTRPEKWQGGERQPSGKNWQQGERPQGQQWQGGKRPGMGQRPPSGRPPSTRPPAGRPTEARPPQNRPPQARPPQAVRPPAAAPQPVRPAPSAAPRETRNVHPRAAQVPKAQAAPGGSPRARRHSSD